MLPKKSSAVGLLLVGHGTRSERGRAECSELAELVAARAPEIPTQLSYLELAEPTIDQSVGKLADAGVRHLIVMPLLLFAAGHAKRDIPDAVERAVQGYPSLSIIHLPHFGCQPEVVELSAERFSEVGQPTPTKMNLAGRDHPTDSETALVLVGRGSHDAEATAEMHRFASLRVERTPVGREAVCFLAMAEPRLEATLEEITSQGWRRIVVQPHLLFHGDLLDRLHAAVGSARQRCPDREWLVAEHLGPAPQLARLIAAQVRESIVAA